MLLVIAFCKFCVFLYQYLRFLNIYAFVEMKSGWSFSADLTLDNERHLFAVDLLWHVLCDSTTLHESLLQVAVWVSIIAASMHSQLVFEQTFQ